MCEEVMNVRLATFFLIPDRFKTQKMCNKASEEDPSSLMYVPDHFKTQKKCAKAFEEDFFSLKFIPDWFVAQQQIKIWYDDYFYDDDYDEVICWYDGYKKKAQTKEELLPIAWHPNRLMDWCMSEEEKRFWT